MTDAWNIQHQHYKEDNFHGVLKGHTGWVTKIETTSQFPNQLVSASRDKSLIVWKLESESFDDDPEANILGKPMKRLCGHSHIVSDVTLSADGRYALSGSWDKTLRLWDLGTGQSTRIFVGHTEGVLSVSISPNNRFIVSGSRDKSIRFWNTLAEQKQCFKDVHEDWISCVRFPPNTSPENTHNLLVSCGWDHLLKVWNMENLAEPVATGKGPNGYITALAISPDGSLCATGGKDGNTDLWDLSELKHLHTLGHKPMEKEANTIKPLLGNIMMELNDDMHRQNKEPIHALTFSPTRYWLAAAVSSHVIIWDLENKQILFDITIKEDTRKQKSRKALEVIVLSLAWSSDGNRLFVGFSDNNIRVWNVTSARNGY